MEPQTTSPGAETTRTPNSQDFIQNPVPTPPKKSKKKLIAIIIGAVLLLLVWAVVSGRVEVEKVYTIEFAHNNEQVQFSESDADKIVAEMKQSADQVAETLDDWEEYKKQRTGFAAGEKQIGISQITDCGSLSSDYIFRPTQADRATVDCIIKGVTNGCQAVTFKETPNRPHDIVFSNGKCWIGEGTAYPSNTPEDAKANEPGYIATSARCTVESVEFVLNKITGGKQASGDQFAQDLARVTGLSLYGGGQILSLSSGTKDLDCRFEAPLVKRF